jgi:hypothetical protein
MACQGLFCALDLHSNSTIKKGILYMAFEDVMSARAIKKGWNEYSL